MLLASPELPYCAGAASMSKRQIQCHCYGGVTSGCILKHEVGMLGMRRAVLR